MCDPRKTSLGDQYRMPRQEPFNADWAASGIRSSSSQGFSNSGMANQNLPQGLTTNYHGP